MPPPFTWPLEQMAPNDKTVETVIKCETRNKITKRKKPEIPKTNGNRRNVKIDQIDKETGIKTPENVERVGFDVMDCQTF